MGNAEELLDSLLELRADGRDLRTMVVGWHGDGGHVFWSSEMEIDNDGDLVLFGD